MISQFSLTERKFNPGIDFSKEELLSINIGEDKFEVSSPRDAFLKFIQYFYNKKKWVMREVMIKKHGFLQAYFYQDENSKNPLKVIDGLYMREISQERAVDLLIKTIIYLKLENFSIEIK